MNGNEKFGLDFQRQVIKQMLQDERFAARCVTYLEEGYFSAELRWFFRKFKDLYTEHNSLPTRSALSNEINKQSATDASKYYAEFKKIQESEPDENYLKKELTGFIRASLFILAYKEAAPLYNSGNREHAYEITKKHLDLISKVDFEKEKVASFGDHVSMIDLASVQAQNAIPTGIRAIDEAMNGGMFPQTWTTFLGGSNSGKSMLMPNLAYFAVNARKKVFLTVHEDEELPTKLRFLSRFSGVPFTKLMAPYTLLTQDEKEALKIADELLKENVKIRYMYSHEATVEQVQQAARMLHKEWPFELFLCDYGQCLTTSRFKSLDNTRLLQEFVYSELKQLCLELNVAGAGGAQVNRLGHQLSKKGTDYLRMSDVAESFGIVRKSSNVITINRSEEDARKNRIVFLLDKVRNGRCPVAVECVTDYNRCIVYTQFPGPRGEPQQMELSELEMGPAGRVDVEKEEEPAQASG